MLVKNEKYNLLIDEYGVVRYASTNVYCDIRYSKYGYYIPGYKNEKGKKLLISELVMETFGEPAPCDGNYEIEHIDGCLTNNHIDNLKWKRKSYNLNSNETYRNKRIMINETGDIYDNIWICSERLDIPVKTIKLCLKNPYVKTKKGYTFTLID